jgi:hydrogenase/urease accessory protein HupE
MPLTRTGAAVLVVCALLPSVAEAHRSGLGSLNVRVEGAEAQWFLRLDAGDLGALLHADADGDGVLTADELLARRPQLETYLLERLTLSTDGVPCVGHVTHVRPALPEAHWLDVAGTFTCPHAMGLIELANRILFDFMREYRHFVDLETPAGFVQRIVSAAEPSLRVRVAESQRAASRGAGGEGEAPRLEPEAGDGEPPVAPAVELPSGTADRIWLFVKEGVHHIFIGFDHILFIVGLTLAARDLKRLAVVVTAFTIAHSITLALASLDLLRVDLGLAEALIALSVAYVGFENVVREPQHRWVLAFVFGLVHGVGFSSVLGELVSITRMDAAARRELLFGFNVGVEVGQLAIVCALYPVLAWLRRGERHRRVVRVASLGILVVGSYWFVERAFGV